MKINLHTSHPSAFISSTFVDLKLERAAIAKALRERGLNVNALDVRPASTDSSKKEIVTGIRESDFVILVVANRYGSILPAMTNSDKLSITWWEYQRAISMEKPVIAYFKAGDEGESVETELHKSQLLRFKKLIATRHNPAYFSDPDDLSEQVRSSLINTYRSGLRRLAVRNEDLENRVASLEAELSHINNKLQAGKKATNRILETLDNPAKAGISNPLFDLINKDK